MPTTKTRRPRRPTDNRAAIAQEALVRAKLGASAANYAAIITEFAARGIPVADIRPRENVFTFHAWRALGRVVRKGEKGVPCLSLVPMAEKEENDTDETKTKRRRLRPRTAYVFHISQTEEVKK